MNHLLKIWSPCQESNPEVRFRRPLFYPLDYRGLSNTIAHNTTIMRAIHISIFNPINNCFFLLLGQFTHASPIVILTTIFEHKMSINGFIYDKTIIIICKSVMKNHRKKVTITRGPTTIIRKSALDKFFNFIQKNHSKK